MASKTKGDPTGQRVNRARTVRRLNERLEKARQQVMLEFRKVPRSRRTVEKIRNQDGTQVVYDYDLNPEQQEIFNNVIKTIIALQLLETVANMMPLRWWYQPLIEQPVRQATLESMSEFNRLVTIAEREGITGAGGVFASRISPEVVLSSQRYLQELRSVYMENFQIIKTLSDNTAAQVIRVINSGMRANNPPTVIAKNINTRFDVSQTNAERIARTEVNRAYNDALMRATKTAEEITGLKAYVRHISALLPDRTRQHHAARHYLVYTIEEENAWWDENANRINCLCSIRTVIKNSDGNWIEA